MSASTRSPYIWQRLSGAQMVGEDAMVREEGKSHGRELRRASWVRGKRGTLLLYILILTGCFVFTLYAGRFGKIHAVLPDDAIFTKWMRLTTAACIIYGHAFGVIANHGVSLILGANIRGKEGGSAEGVIAQIGEFTSLSVWRLLYTRQFLLALTWLLIMLFCGSSAAGAIFVFGVTGDYDDYRYEIIWPGAYYSFIGIGYATALTTLVHEWVCGGYDVLTGHWVTMALLDHAGRLEMSGAQDRRVKQALYGRKLYLRDVSGEAMVGRICLSEDPDLPTIRPGRPYA